MFVVVLACVTSPPKESGPAVLTLRDGNLVLDETVVAPADALAASPTTELDDDLVAALRPAAGREIAVVLAPETPVWVARKVVGSAREAGLLPTAIGTLGSPERFPLTGAPRYGLETTCDAPRVVRSTEPLVTLSIQSGADGAWVLATAQFLPTFGPSAGDAVDGLPPACLAVPSCEETYPGDPALRAACEEGGGDHRVALGGVHGCLLPIARKPADVGSWRAELPSVVASLDLGSRPLLLVMPEARVRLDAVLAVLGGFRDAGANVPALGLSLLVEGNDGPPICDADVRDAASLAAAGARWLGGVRHAVADGASVTATAGSPPPR